jgi:hypothetical protein
MCKNRSPFDKSIDLIFDGIETELARLSASKQLDFVSAYAAEHESRHHVAEVKAAAESVAPIVAARRSTSAADMSANTAAAVASPGRRSSAGNSAGNGAATTDSNDNNAASDVKLLIDAPASNSAARGVAYEASDELSMSDVQALWKQMSGEPLGFGAFGKVFKAVYHGVPRAVRVLTIQGTTLQPEDLITEV